MTITGGSALPKEDIDRMVKDAEAHAAEDKKRREEAETRNSAEQLAYSTEKLLKDNADKLSDDVKSEVEKAVADVRTALEGSDLDAVKTAHSALLAAGQKIGEAVYANQGAAESGSAGAGAGAGAGSTGSAASDEDVVDAEIVDDEDTTK